MLSEWLRLALSFSGLKQIELSRYLSERLSRSVDASAIHKMSRGSRRMFADEMLLISKICRYDCPYLSTLEDIPGKEELERRDVVMRKQRDWTERETGKQYATVELIGVQPEAMKKLIVFEISQMEATLTNKQINATADRIIAACREDMMAEHRIYETGKADA